MDPSKENLMIISCSLYWPLFYFVTFVPFSCPFLEKKKEKQIMSTYIYRDPGAIPRECSFKVCNGLSCIVGILELECTINRVIFCCFVQFHRVVPNFVPGNILTSSFSCSRFPKRNCIASEVMANHKEFGILWRFRTSALCERRKKIFLWKLSTAMNRGCNSM